MSQREKREKRESCCPLVSSEEKRNEANALAASVKSQMPAGLAQPALRAIAAAGITKMHDFTRITEAELLAMHGMGPKAVGIIRAALAERGKAFLA